MAITLERVQDYWVGHFTAMASPCELLIDVTPARQARQLTELAEHEAKRIEQKFSRYRTDNIVYQINNANGLTISVDEETAGLLDYAQQCHKLSEGLFDITSGGLREAWHFDTSDNIPSKKKVAEILQHVGWHKLNWQRPILTMPEEMQIDFGGIGKEYAVDRVALMLKQRSDASVLLNFGGDLVVTQPRKNGLGWFIGVENPATTNTTMQSTPIATEQFELAQGAVATSGDVRRYLLKNGVRYSHILDPRTGWPVPHAPHSVTVIAETCTDAGILATLAILHGAQAEAFLDTQEVRYRCIRK